MPLTVPEADEVRRAARPVGDGAELDRCPCRSATRQGSRSRSACSAGTWCRRRPRTSCPSRWPPRAKFSCCCANAANCGGPPYPWYSALVMYRPNACGVASLEPMRGTELERVALRPALPQPQLGGQVGQQQARQDAAPARTGPSVPHARAAAPAAARPRRSRRCRRGSACHRQPGDPARCRRAPSAGRHRQVRAHLRARCVQRLVGQRDLGGAPEHVALPLGAAVVVVREGGDDLTRRAWSWPSRRCRGPAPAGAPPVPAGARG